MNEHNAAVASNGPSLAVSDVDRILIRSIVARAFRDAVSSRNGVPLMAALDFVNESEADARETLRIDITVAHANGSPINLPKLLDADEETFAFDVVGIQRNVDRRTGKLRRAFVPRTAMSQADIDDRDKRLAIAQENMKSLISAAEHAGATRVHLEHAKAKEVEAARKRKADNARRRKSRNANKGVPKAGQPGFLRARAEGLTGPRSAAKKSSRRRPGRRR